MLFNQKGQGLVEYALIVLLVAIIVVAFVMIFEPCFHYGLRSCMRVN